MRCPECHTLNEAGATACASCGLLLLKVQPEMEQRRRAEDFAHQKRRATDKAVIACPYCSGEIAADAIRCRHCSEIVNDDFYRARARRIRARVNYASWVAYIFGLAAMLVFRPVGLVSIAAGLLLSIVYYAIPVEPPEVGKRDKKRGRFWRVVKQQLRMERVAVPIPALRKKRLVFVGTPLIAAVIGYTANLFLLQQPMNEVLHANSTFNGMKVSAHYEYWVVPGVLVYDLRALSVRQRPIDVHTAFLEFAKKMRTRRFKTIELSYRGTEKFEIDGASFHRLGDEYAKRNFDFVLNAFPHLVHAAPGVHAIRDGSDHDALLQFHRQWYGNDWMTQSLIANR